MPTAPRIALITSAQFPQLYQDDFPLVAELERRGVVAIPTIWSDASIDWSGFSALVIRSPWDYFERLAEFRQWLSARIHSGALMCNSADVLEWNFDKTYLAQLERTVPIVPTIFIARGEKRDLAALARERGWDEIVIKPTISGGAYRTHRLKVTELEKHASEIAETLSDRGLMLQPFLPEISQGELSLLFFDGEYSHAVRKMPKAGEYRVQFQYGGTNQPFEPYSALIEQARTCVLAAPSLPVYARVDGIVLGGRFLLMELEAFEPLMFLTGHPQAARRFADAILGRLGAAGTNVLARSK